MNRLPRFLAWMFPRNVTETRPGPPPPFPAGVDRSAVKMEADGPASRVPPRPHVLFLRTFGSDGDTKVGNPKEGDDYEKITIEEILDLVASEFGLPVQALRDPRAKSIPQPIKAYESSDDDWFRDVQRFIESAACAVVFSSGSLDLGPSFQLELEAIRTGRLRYRTVIVCPPTLGFKPHGTKSRIFEALGWPVPELMPLVAWRLEPGSGGMVPSLGPEDDSLADRYEGGLRDALESIIGSG